MSERDSYNPGEFCFVDLAVPSTEAGAEFYNELLGVDWEQGAEEFGGYGMFTQKGKVVGGMGPLQSEGQPPAWSNYVSVEDAAATAAKVKEAGGTVLAEPFDIATAGRMAVFQDPQGAFFSVWQANETPGAQLVNEVGTWTWNHLTTPDLDGAKKFYGDVFGWKLERADEAPPDLPFFMWQVKDQKWDEGIAGAAEMGEGNPLEVPPNWMAYFAVADADKAVKTANDGGGQVMVPVTPTPVGKLAVFTDPQGAALGIIEPDYPEPR
jgi:predicted enzyme related to lactoylglutathione lyase